MEDKKLTQEELEILEREFYGEAMPDKAPVSVRVVETWTKIRKAVRSLVPGTKSEEDPK